MPLLVPSSDWVIPTELPDLKRFGRLALDTETKDDGLAQGRGAGWVYKAGYVCGVAMAWKGGRIYVPVAHPDTKNFDHATVGRWLKDHLANDSIEFIFQNAGYDLGWIDAEWGIAPPAKMQDTMVQAYMLAEDRFTYNLDDLCKWQGLPGKDETLLRDAAATYCGAKTEKEIKESIHRLPARFAGPYGEQDAESTLNLNERLTPQLIADSLMEAYQLEIDLIPLGIEMRKRGVRVDVDYAVQAQTRLLKQRDELLKELSRRLTIGRACTIGDISSEKFLERVFTAEKVPFPRTPPSSTRPNGTASFKTEWMEHSEHWLPKGVCKALQLQDAGKKFIGDYILGYAHFGRVHAEINFTKTKTTRLSYNDPPLQQMTSPDKHPDIGKVIRDIFLPEEDTVWGALDYSQQEPRLTVHFASLCKISGADVAVDYFHNAPKPDYHTMVSKLTGLPRPQAKIINLGLAYGMGKWKLAASLGVTIEKATEILNQYHEAVPFNRGLTEYCSRLADKRGYIRMLDGARGRFNLWEPRWHEREKEKDWLRAGGDIKRLEACSEEEAKRRIQDPSHPWGGRIKRAYAHKAMNKLVQGSAARQTKLAMRECWRENIIPLLQMHDELDFPFDSKKVAERAKEIMTNVVPLRVPVRVDDEYGLRWGSAKKTWDEVKNAA